MPSSIGALVDLLSQGLGLRRSASIPKPLAPVVWDQRFPISREWQDQSQLAAKLNSLRPEVSVEEFEKQVKSPIASRGIAVWVRVRMPQLNREMVLDTRVDNPKGLPKSLRDLTPTGAASPWPELPRGTGGTPGLGDDGRVVPLGHSGSSCPGMFSNFSILNQGRTIEIPVEVLAFHAEGDNGVCKYSIGMFSEVTGRLTASLPGHDRATLTMWGKMLISIRPHKPREFGGHELIQLRSREYIEQRGQITGFPPHSAGEYLESKGNEVYEGFHPGQRHITAIVEQGRIIFSTDIDDFLQARTRISSFTLLDQSGKQLDAGAPPYDSSLIGQIGGVRLAWEDVRGRYPHITHYRLYRMDPDKPENVELVGEMITENTYTDTAYDGTRSLAYAVVPAFVDSAGVEVQGVSLDHSTIMHVHPKSERFVRRNIGVGHIRWMK